jgi:hypothetical protein
VIRISPAFAALVLLGSAGIAAQTVRHALSPAVAPAASQSGSFPSTPKVSGPPAMTPAKLLAAVGKDPFHPERRRPAMRFRLPGEGLPNAPDSAATPRPFKLIGTAAMAEGSGFAMCQLGEDAPKLVRIGESFGGLTLKRVLPGSAVFLTAAGKRYEVQVPKAGS